jgi:hypothetical protein
MKKVAVLLFALLLAVGVQASGKPMSLGINFGVLTDDGFSFDPLNWTAGAELDIKFGNYLMFSPEVTLVANGFKFEKFTLYPAAILNFTTSSFFVGGGITKAVYIDDDDSDSSKVALKLNAGLLSSQMKLSAYVITEFKEIFKEMQVGASLGFKF